MGLAGKFRSLFDDSFDEFKARWLRRNYLDVLFERPRGDGKRLCVFAHFDPERRVAPWTRHYLKQLREAGFATVLVSTAALSPDEVTAIRDDVTGVIVRTNRGYDFASWKTGLDHLGHIPREAEVLLVNESAIGPFFDLRPLFDALAGSGAPVWGLTDNFEYRPHLQSYFLWFRGVCFENRAFRAFWRGVRLKTYKPGIIQRYEIGFSEMVEQSGLIWKAKYPYAAIRARALARPDTSRALRAKLEREPANPLHDLWRVLLEDFDFPFLKKELILRNPLNIPEVASWPARVRQRPGLLDSARRLLP